MGTLGIKGLSGTCHNLMVESNPYYSLVLVSFKSDNYKAYNWTQYCRISWGVLGTLGMEGLSGTCHNLMVESNPYYSLVLVSFKSDN